MLSASAAMLLFAQIATARRMASPRGLVFGAGLYEIAEVMRCTELVDGCQCFGGAQNEEVQLQKQTLCRPSPLSRYIR